MAIDKFIHRVEQALERLVTLNIVTYVGTVQIQLGSESARTKITSTEGGGKTLWTAINLAQGDITTVIHPELQGDVGREVLEFHKQRETQGIEIIRGNVVMLKGLVGLLGDAYKKHSEQPAALASGAANKTAPADEQ